MNNPIKKRNALGRGLSALLESADTDASSIEPKVLNSVASISIGQIEANPFQPRTEFDEDGINELSESIKVHGIIQPITVRKIGFEKYQIISGERRTRASILAGLTEIPAYIRVANDQEMLEMAIIENIQREELNPVEIALSYKRLLEECNLKQEELGERVGKNRTTVNNYLRLLKLPDEIQLGLKNNKISMGHARALINIAEPDWQMEIYQRVITEGLSVRAVENLVKKGKPKPGTNKRTKESVSDQQHLPVSNDFDEYKNFGDMIARKFKANVDIKPLGGEKGSIVIEFENRSHFKEILKLL
ncbi:MAG: ParB/RepB/Spo0J family partition protein [Flavobacteriales bacterium]|nr:ParB/RepB/Spo0J family partition protein [Flavobacteriales bacterium]